ncbi:hypothetical protein [Sorangium sp. So ce590]
MAVLVLASGLKGHCAAKLLSTDFMTFMLQALARGRSTRATPA